MKFFTPVVFCLIVTPLHAMEPMPCDKIEYAELKDMTKPEMAKAYCSAVTRRGINERFYTATESQYKEITSGGQFAPRHEKEMNALVEARIFCMREVDRIESTFQKKFRTKPPACANSSSRTSQ